MYPNGIPTPGSDEALELGCECAILDNGHGRGYMGGPFFAITGGCPIHDKPKDDPIVIESSD